jgi:predicted adenylyl cyclase CyaB
MPLNLEAKIPLPSFDSIIKKLNKLNAKFVSTLNQRDVYFSNKYALLKLRIENGNESLIRYSRDEKANDRFSDYEVIKLSSTGAEKFFNKIFKVEVIVEKRRLLYMYDNTRIHLDKIKLLGNFLELETLVLKGKADARKRFNKLIKLLDLDLESQIKKSNYNLLKSYLQK